ncbi:MAG: hypothetical protein RSC76_06675, partial [Oscillospiraceae bacterium]
GTLYRRNLAPLLLFLLPEGFLAFRKLENYPWTPPWGALRFLMNINASQAPQKNPPPAFHRKPRSGETGVACAAANQA